MLAESPRKTGTNLGINLDHRYKGIVDMQRITMVGYMSNAEFILTEITDNGDGCITRTRDGIEMNGLDFSLG